MRNFLFSFILLCYAAVFMGAYRIGLPHPDILIGYIDDISFVILLTFFLHIVFLLLTKSRNFVLYPAIILLQLMLVAEWWHYEFYRDYIHYASLGYAGNWREILRGVTGFQGRYVALLISFGLLLMLYYIDVYFKTHTFHHKALKYTCIAFGFSAVFLLGFITKIYSNVTIDNWQTKGSIPLALKNPLLELLREKFIGKNKIAHITERHIDALQKLYGARISKDRHSNSPFYMSNSATVKAAEKRYNVIFIVLESFRDYEVGKQGEFSLTPNFDRISKGNFTPQYFYTNSNQTIKAEIALLCGMHDFLVGTSISAYDMNFEVRCLPKIFQENGYDSIWFHGGYASFYGRDTFFPKVGFNKMHDRAVIEDSLYASGKNYFIRHWGVEDPYVFNYAFEKLEKQKQPFFAEIMSLSSHHPFFDIQNRWDMKDYPKGIQGDMSSMYRKYQHVTYYTDKALGQFWDAFSKSTLYDDTVVVIVGDHGIWLFPDGMEERASEAQLYEAYTRLPLTIYFPGKNFSNEITAPLSQVDIPALIMAYMGLDNGTAFQSGLTHDQALALLNDQRSDDIKSNPVFATIGDGYFFRQEDKRCFPSVASKGACNDYLFRCVKKYNVLQEDEACFSWQGDILHETGLVNRESPDLDSENAVVDYFRNALFVVPGLPAEHK